MDQMMIISRRLNAVSLLDTFCGAQMRCFYVYHI